MDTKKQINFFIIITLILSISLINPVSAEKRSGSIQISADFGQVGTLTADGDLIIVGNNDYGLIGGSSKIAVVDSKKLDEYFFQSNFFTLWFIYIMYTEQRTVSSQGEEN